MGTGKQNSLPHKQKVITLIAFYKDRGFLAKVYKSGDDWQVTTSLGDEYWFSVWQADKPSSLYNAIIKTCRLSDVEYKQENVVIC